MNPQLPGFDRHLRESPSILLVDDDPLLLDVQRRVLRRMGYEQVTVAASAREALLQIEYDAKAAEVILCDLLMPEVDGIQFLLELNTSPFRGSVILLSGQNVRILNSVQRMLGDGRLTILGSVSKPARPESLRALLERWTPPLAEPLEVQTLEFERADMEKAREERQWLVHYQPQVDLESGLLVGLEALVRWLHPLHGLLLPERFIEQVERRGAIESLTDYVIEEAVAQQHIWQTAGLAVQMSINLSPLSLERPGFWRRIGDHAQKVSVAPADVTLEVTEGRLTSFSATALENLIRLRMNGFSLSIDDFGMGHSSLGQLRDVPFTELKIDRGFVSGARSNQIIRPMLEGSLGIAQGCGLQSVAEGVETHDDWQLVRELGCNRAQGHFVGRAMPASMIWEWLARWNARRAQFEQ